MADNRRTPATQQRNYNNTRSPAKRKERLRAEAAARQEAYAALTVEERIARAEARRGESLKELALLNAQQALISPSHLERNAT